jgi:hypothetical protein
MSKTVKTAFSRHLFVDVKRLVPSRTQDARGRTHEKYKQIEASITAVGVIEPLVVFAIGKGSYRILDGHKRHDILLRSDVKQVMCIIATEDENYTYNRRVNYLSPVGEHQMILRALEHNSEELIATALNVNVDTIRLKRDLLNGVCKEAVDVLKDQRVTARAFSVLKKMKPIRQVEAAQLMVASHTYTGRFAEALLAGTRDELLVPDGIARSNKCPSQEQKAQLERETERLIHDLKGVEDSYGTDVLTLSVLSRYVGRVVASVNVRGSLKGRHSELLEALDTLISSVDAEAA